MRIISPKIGAQIKDYALYRYSALDVNEILKMAKELSEGCFDNAFQVCR
jgi:hypothetical protein